MQLELTLQQLEVRRDECRDVDLWEDFTRFISWAREQGYSSTDRFILQADSPPPAAR